MPIVSHCPSLSPPADFCSTCGAAPLRVCLRKRASQRIDEISDCLLPIVLRSCGVVVAPKFICICCQVVQVLSCLMLHRVISCHIMLLLAEPHSPTFLFAPHPSPSALATRCHEGRGGHQGCRASGSARDLGHGRHNGTLAKVILTSWCWMPCKKEM